jgi:hypothetical protein
MAPELAYGAAIASTTRNAMLSAAVTCFYFGRHDKMVAALALIDHVGKLSGRRNDIAHGTIMRFSGSPYNGFYQCPPSYHTGKSSHHTMKKEKPSLAIKYQYNDQQIMDFADAFDAARAKVRAMWMEALDERTPTSPETPQ